MARLAFIVFVILLCCHPGYCGFAQLEDTTGIGIIMFGGLIIEGQFQCVYEAFVETGKTLPQGELSHEDAEQFMEKAMLLAQEGLEESEGNINRFVFDHRVEKWRTPQKYEELAFYRRVHLQDGVYAYAAMTYNGLFVWNEEAIFDFMPWKSEGIPEDSARGGVPYPNILHTAEPTRDIAPGTVKFIEGDDSAEILLGQDTRIILRKIPPGISRNGSPVNAPGRIVRSAFSESLQWNPEDYCLTAFPLEDKPLHDVVISKPFWLGEQEMCLNQFYWFYFDEGFDNDSIPATDISWQMAMDYCSLLNKLLSGKLPQGYKFSLPLEEQWEYACRAGISPDLGNESDHPGEGTGKCPLDRYGWHVRNIKPGGYPSKTALLQPNAWGLFDMHGNMEEWCYDRPHSHALLPGVPAGIIGSNFYNSHVLRGGSFMSNPGDCRAASRSTSLGDLHTIQFGFRLALIPEELTPEEPSPFSEETMALRGQQHQSERAGGLCFILPQGIKLDVEMIPAGECLAGSPEKEVGRIDSEYWREDMNASSGKTGRLKPHISEAQHTVAINQSFWLGRFEVTREQYAAVVGADMSILANRKRPMTQVFWEDAISFCERLNVLCRDQLPEGYRFAIPTEEQWEYACRAGTTTALNSGKDLTQGEFFCPNLAEVAWFQMNSGERKRDAGLLRPNAWGLYDMHGNVWEWCVCTEPADDGPLSGSVLRGGSWYDPPRFCRSAMRRWLDEDRGGPDIGFRVALVPAEPDAPQNGEAQR